MWFGHVERRDQELFGIQTLGMAPRPWDRNKSRIEADIGMLCVNSGMRSRPIGSTKKMDYITELAGREFGLSQRPHNYERAARR